MAGIIGLHIPALIPITAFALGTWQVFRLGWKTELIAKFEDRLIREPLPLPPQVDPLAVKDFDYRRVYATGHFRHDQEMLIGPRMHDGNNGYLVITPLERNTEGSTVLVNRGWIPKKFQRQAVRKDGLPQAEVTVQGLLRVPWKKNMFTPENKPEAGEFYFPDVEQMAKISGSQPIWIEETMGMADHNIMFQLKLNHDVEPDLLKAYDREARGIPIGRAAEVNLRNNHTQYIFTCWLVGFGND
ncbi:surf-like protein [Ptychographa xylographoides]|nr:surf-like protein [Ptychographa xylographoides]